MKPIFKSLSLFLLCCAVATGAGAQHRHAARRKAAPAAADGPNVSGTPAYITAPAINQAPTQPQPEINVDVKRERKVRVVPAPPPPGPIAPPIPPKE